MSIIKPSRRDILKLAAIAPGFALPAVLPRTARADLGVPSGENPGHFHFTLGEAKMTVLSDGYFTMPTRGMGVNAKPEDVQAFLKAHYLNPQVNYNHTNHLFIELGDAKVLVDVGSGTRYL